MNFHGGHHATAPGKAWLPALLSVAGLLRGRRTQRDRGERRLFLRLPHWHEARE